MRAATPPSDRAGVALPLALAVMVAVTVISATAIQVALSDYQANRGARLSARALFAAEAGAQRMLATWDGGAWTSLQPGDSASSGWVRLPDGSRYRSVVLRVDDAADVPLYRVLTEGRPSRTGTARRMVLTMVRGGESAPLVTDGAARVRGRLQLRGMRDPSDPPMVDGRDHVPTAWASECPSAGSAVAGAILGRSSDLRLQRDATVAGSPGASYVGTMGTDVTQTIGPTTWDDLVAQADWSYSGTTRFRNAIGPSASGGVCNTSDRENWGAPEVPSSVCSDYAPIIYVDGNLRIDRPGQGQGILVVDGNLDIRKEFNYYGVVIVNGRLIMRDEGFIAGAVVVRGGRNGNQTSLVRNESRIRFSSCAVARVSTGSGGTDFLPGRWWFEMP